MNALRSAFWTATTTAAAATGDGEGAGMESRERRMGGGPSRPAGTLSSPSAPSAASAPSPGPGPGPGPGQQGLGQQSSSSAAAAEDAWLQEMLTPPVPLSAAALEKKARMALHTTEFDRNGDVKESNGKYYKADLCAIHNLQPRDLRVVRADTLTRFVTTTLIRRCLVGLHAAD